ncbi:MAG: hypothetical protein WBB22_16425 [Anaerolineae bacterium]
MSTTIYADGDFVELWIKARTAEAKLDKHILELVDNYRKGTLDEAGLFAGLVAFGEDKEGTNGPD